jgi:uncharacterized FlgJ-related protein
MTNDQIIYNVAIQNGFTPIAAKLVVAQARFESADYTSNVFKNNLNTSGMKYAGQPLATKGTLAPYSERTSACQASGICINGDYYAKFRSVEDSARDKIERNFAKTMGGVTPDQLKNVKTPEEFANLLKRRSYYGSSESGYASGLKAKLLRLNVIEFYQKYKNPINYAVIGGVLVGIGAYLFYLKKKGIIFKK